jgi:hypothetical protein
MLQTLKERLHRHKFEWIEGGHVYADLDGENTWGGARMSDGTPYVAGVWKCFKCGEIKNFR